MKKLLPILFVLFAFCTVHNTQAKGVVVYHNGPKFEIREKLPPQAIVNQKHVNIGVAYEQFGIFWLPLWNYGTTTYALVTDDKEVAWTLTNEELEAIKTEYNIDIELPENPSPTLWNQIGIKPIIILLLLAVIWGLYDESKKKKEEKV